MTSPAVSVAVDAPLRDVVAVLARSEFDGVPVVDGNGVLVGMVTQNDLVAKAGLRARPEILALLWRGDSGQEVLDSDLFASVTAGLSAKDVMVKNPPAISPEATLAEAIKIIASANLKRLAVVDKDKRLIGMLARIDILRVASAGSARRRVLESYGAKVPGATPVGATTLLQVPTVTPDTPALEVVNLLDGESQRVVVLDERGAPAGVISDRDLLPLLGDKGARKARELTAAALMRTDIPAIQEDASIEQALSLMVELRRKRLPVVDGNGRYLGMLSREELLRILAPDGETL
jgi:CBS domain-containing protein